MAAQITAAILMLLFTWFSVHKCMKSRKGSTRLIYGFLALIAFLSWSGNALVVLGLVPWLTGSIVVAIVLVSEGRHANNQ